MHHLAVLPTRCMLVGARFGLFRFILLRFGSLDFRFGFVRLGSFRFGLHVHVQGCNTRPHISSERASERFFVEQHTLCIYNYYLEVSDKGGPIAFGRTLMCTAAAAAAAAVKGYTI